MRLGCDWHDVPAVFKHAAAIELVRLCQGKSEWME